MSQLKPTLDSCQLLLFGRSNFDCRYGKCNKAHITYYFLPVKINRKNRDIFNYETDLKLSCQASLAGNIISISRVSL